MFVLSNMMLRKIYDEDAHNHMGQDCNLNLPLEPYETSPKITMGNGLHPLPPVLPGYQDVNLIYESR